MLGINKTSMSFIFGFIGIILIGIMILVVVSNGGINKEEYTSPEVNIADESN
ncbi:MAG: hypothetical protein KAR54_00270 [Candidatus Pacebacteria bacterium]|nr:hypothetical protein [Candidatus Paceibacterota bacterium]